MSDSIVLSPFRGMYISDSEIHGKDQSYIDSAKDVFKRHKFFTDSLIELREHLDEKETIELNALETLMAWLNRENASLEEHLKKLNLS